MGLATVSGHQSAGGGAQKAASVAMANGLAQLHKKRQEKMFQVALGGSILALVLAPIVARKLGWKREEMEWLQGHRWTSVQLVERWLGIEDEGKTYNPTSARETMMEKHGKIITREDIVAAIERRRAALRKARAEATAVTE